MPRFPVRTCVGCRTACPAAELVCLIAPEGRVRVAQRGAGQAAVDEAPGKRGALVRERGVIIASGLMAGGAIGGVIGAGLRLAPGYSETLINRARTARTMPSWSKPQAASNLDGSPCSTKRSGRPSCNTGTVTPRLSRNSSTALPAPSSTGAGATCGSASA